MKQKAVFLLCLIILILFFTPGCGPAVISGFESEPVNIMLDPVQENVGQPLEWRWKIAGGDFKITAVSQYQVSALVMSSAHYSSGWQSALAPVDLALVWGQLTDPALQKYIAYSQSNRWYYYHFDAGCPVSGSYIASHSSNHHLIPATANIRDAIREIKRLDTIRLDGYLVNLRGIYLNREYWWNTSTSRLDTGDGACELMLVEKVRIGEKIYQ